MIMTDKEFYTPKNGSSKSLFKTPVSEYYTPHREMSDSEESVQSNRDVNSTPSSLTGSGELTLVAQFDDLLRLLLLQRNDEVEDAFIDFVDQAEDMRIQYQIAIQECRRLQHELDIKTHDLSDLESKLIHARKIVDQEKRHTRKIEDERDALLMQVNKVRNFLFRDNHNRLPDETREQLAFLNNDSHYTWDPNIPTSVGPQLSAIPEVNTTGSLLSDFSYSRSEDDLDVSALHCGKSWKKHRPSTGAAPEPANKKRKSSTNKVVEITNNDSVRATTTLTVPKYGPITATSIIESVPLQNEGNQKVYQIQDCPNPHLEQTDIIYDMWQNSPKKSIKSNVRQHILQTKTIVMPDTCGPCEKRIRFGKTALKCKDCRATCHPECKDNLPLPCIPYVNTPTQRNLLGLISDYTPTTPPMVPAIIIHCINEIELRGLNEIGIYRIPGSERDVKQLKEKFLRGKGSPCLSQLDVHVICGTVKDFLRSLHEPIITYGLWADFVKAVENNDPQCVSTILYQIISELPQPNRDTLAYMILHLKRVGVSVDCKMPISNLSKIFGPTIVGYSSPDPEHSTLLKETKQQNMVMEYLMNLPTEYWSGFIDVSVSVPSQKLQQTPSTDSLLRPNTTRGFFTPHSVRSATKKKQKFFPTPPSYRN